MVDSTEFLVELLLFPSSMNVRNCFVSCREMTCLKLLITVLQVDKSNRTPSSTNNIIICLNGNYQLNTRGIMLTLCFYLINCRLIHQVFISLESVEILQTISGKESYVQRPIAGWKNF